MDNSLAAIFTLFNQESTGLSTGVTEKTPEGSSASFESFLLRAVPRDARALAAAHSVFVSPSASAANGSEPVVPRPENTTDISSFAPVISGADLLREGDTSVIHPAVPAPDGTGFLQNNDAIKNSSLDSAPVFTQVPTSFAVNTTPDNFPEYDVSAPLPAVSPEKPPFDSGISVTIPLTRVTAVMDALPREEHVSDPRQYVLELELPSVFDKQRDDATLIIPARIVPKEPAPEEGLSGNSGAGKFLLSAVRLGELLQTEIQGGAEIFPDSGGDPDIPASGTGAAAGSDNGSTRENPGMVQVHSETVHVSQNLEKLITELIQIHREHEPVIPSHEENGTFAEFIPASEPRGEGNAPGQRTESPDDVLQGAFVPVDNDVSDTGTVEEHPDRRVLPPDNKVSVTLPVLPLLDLSRSDSPEIVIAEFPSGVQTEVETGFGAVKPADGQPESESGQEKSIQLIIRPEEVAGALGQLPVLSGKSEIKNSLNVDTNVDTNMDIRERDNTSGELPATGKTETFPLPGKPVFTVYIREISHTELLGETIRQDVRGESQSVVDLPVSKPSAGGRFDENAGKLPREIPSANPDGNEEARVLLQTATAGGRTVPGSGEHVDVINLQGFDELADTLQKAFSERAVVDRVPVEIDLAAGSSAPVNEEAQPQPISHNLRGISSENVIDALPLQSHESLPAELAGDIEKIHITLNLRIPPQKAQHQDAGHVPVAGQELQTGAEPKTLREPSVAGHGQHEEIVAESFPAVRENSVSTANPPLHKTAAGGDTAYLRNEFLTFAQTDISYTGDKIIITLNDHGNGNSQISEQENSSFPPVLVEIDAKHVQSVLPPESASDAQISLPVVVHREGRTFTSVLKLPFAAINEMQGGGQLPEKSAGAQVEFSAHIPGEETAAVRQEVHADDGSHTTGDTVPKTPVTGRDGENSSRGDHMPESTITAEHEPVVLRIPVKTVSGEKSFSGATVKHIQNIPVVDGEQTDFKPGAKITPEQSQPTQISVHIETDDTGMSKEGVKIQGMFVARHPGGTRIKHESPASAETAGEPAGDMTSPTVQGVHQGDQLFNYSNDDARAEKHLSKHGQTTGNTRNVQSANGLAVHNVFEIKPDNIIQPSPEQSLPVRTIEDLADRIVRRANLIRKKGVAEFHIQLSPPHLGKMLLKISVEDSQMTASVRVETHEAQKLIQNNQHQLHDSIMERGINIQKFDVFVQQNGQFGAYQPPGTGYDRSSRNSGGNYSQNTHHEQNVPGDNNQKAMRLFGYNTMELVA